MSEIIEVDGEVTLLETTEEVIELLEVVEQGPAGPPMPVTAGNGILVGSGNTVSIDPDIFATQNDLSEAVNAGVASATTTSNSYTDDGLDALNTTTQAYSDQGDAAALAAATVAIGLVDDRVDLHEYEIGQLQDGLGATNQTATNNYNALNSAKASQAALNTLQSLVDTKASTADLNAAVALLVGTAPEALNTIYEIAAQLQGDEAVIAGIMTAIANCVRFDAAQTLTNPQEDQARSNIKAEKVGVAAALVAAVTTASIGAATSAQGVKADTALQSGDVAPVALSGSFSDLINKSSLFNLVYSAYVIGSNTAILATDTLGQMLGKLQAQINAKENTISSGTTAQYWRGDKTWRSFATDVLATALTGLSTATATVITSADTPLSALGKLQAQITAALRPSNAVNSSSGIVTIDLANGTQVFLLTLTENVTSWTFSNPPASGFVAEIRIKLTQGASTAYTCVSPATSGMTAGGAWVNSSTLGAIESLGIAVDSAGNKTLFPSGVYA